MILRFRHRGLRRLFESGDTSGLNPQHLDIIARILARLDRATQAHHMNLPGWRLHPLRGDYAGFWSVTVRANWRIVFRFENGDATDVDYLDYH